MKKLQENILKLQKIDPLSVAEELTGDSYKESAATSALGFMLQMKKNQELRIMLSKADDTQFTNTVVNYLRITEKFGFEVVYKEPFNSERGEENLYVLFQKELGILICFDTFTFSQEPNVNSCNMYYNWSPNSLIENRLTSSGHFYFAEKNKHMTLFEEDLKTTYEIENYPASVKWEDELSYEEFNTISKPVNAKQEELFALAIANGKRVLWSGYHDGREGIITIINAMLENGKFFPVWHDSPFNWITNYMDHKDKTQYPFTEYYDITKQRIARMPKYVQDCIAGPYNKKRP